MLFIRLLTIGLAISICRATKPPGYIEKPKPYDPHPPNYDYSYSVADHHGGQQGHLEKRNGEHTQGHYFVDDPKESSSQEVRYLADDWGFHPLVKYSSKTPSGYYSARFALGEQAVKEFSQEQNIPKGTTPIAPLLAGTVLPAGTSTDGFIHYDNKNGVQTLHPMALQSHAPSANVFPQQSVDDPRHQNVLQLVPVLPTIPQPQFYETQPLTTVLSPVQPESYNYVQNINSSPNGNVQYYSNINGHNSKSNVNVELGPRGPPNTNSLEDPDKSNNENYNKLPTNLIENNYDENSDGDEDGNLPIPEGLISESINAGITGYDSETLNLHNNGGFGSKLTVSTKSDFKSNIKNSPIKKPQKPSYYVVSSTTSRPISSTTKKTVLDSKQYSKLVETTQNLVSNEDLLSINGAAEPYFVNQGGKVEDSIHYAQIQNSGNAGQKVVTIQPSPTVFTLQGTVRVADNPASKKPSGAGIISIEHEGRFRNTHGDVFKSPIVVADFDYTNNFATSTPATYVENGNIYSTTQRTVELEGQNSVEYIPLQGYTGQPSSTTILVTPRPVSQKFLAPLNAGLRLVTNNNVEKFLDCPNPPHSSDVKEVEDDVIEQENVENNALKTVVELFKSVPLENVNDSESSSISQVKQLAESLRNHQTNTNNLQEYPSALEDSKRIQQTSNQQLYQYGAQQVLIHPAEQQNQLAAEELHQQLEESNEESIKHESIQNQVQRGVDKDQVVLHYPTNNLLPVAQPLVHQHVIYHNDNEYKSSQSVVNLHNNQIENHNQLNSINVQPHTISYQHYNNHLQSNNNHGQQQSVHVQNNEVQASQPIYQQTQQYLVYGVPQHNIHYSQQSYPIHVAQSYRQDKKITVPYVSNYQDVNSVPYYVDQQVNIAHKPQPLPVYVQQSSVVETNIPYPVPVQQVVEKKIPVGVKVPVKVEVLKPYPVEKNVEKPVEVTKYINTPYPVEKPVPYPAEVEKVVENKVPYKVEVAKPYPVPVQVPYAVAYSGHSIPQANQHIFSTQNSFLPNAWAIGYNLNQQFFNNIKQHSQPIKQAEPSKYPPIADSYYRKNLGPYGQSHTYTRPTTYLVSVADNNAQHSHNVNQYYKHTPSSKPVNDYFNLKNTQLDLLNNNNYNGFNNHYNSPSSFNVGSSQYSSNLHHFSNSHHNLGNNNNYNNHQFVNPHFRQKKEREAKGLRVEYGFKPPLIPSLEIDMEGRPIKREKP